MAIVNGKSGTFNIYTYNSSISGYVAWQETYDNSNYSSTNKSTIKMDVYLHRTNIYSGDTFLQNIWTTRIAYFGSEEVKDERNLTMTIAGNSSSSGGPYTHVYTASKEITHDSDGSKTITLGYYMTNSYVGTTGGNAFAVDKTTSTVTLTKIPRYGTSNQSFKSKTSTSITMNWSSDNTVDYVWYSKDNGSNWTAVGSVNSTSGSYTIPSLSPNTTYNIKTRIRRKDSQLTTDSSATSVTTYQATNATISFSSKTETSITVTSGCNVTVSSTKYRIKQSGGSYGSWQTSATFNNLSANTTYYVQVEKVGSSSGEAGYAETSAITTHDYPHCTESPNFTIGNKLTLKFYNPLGRSISIKGYGADNSVIFSGNTTSTSLEGFNDADSKVAQYESIPDSTSGTYKVEVTYSTSKRIRSNNNTYTINSNDCKPTFTNFEYSTNLSELTGNNDTIIDGKTSTTFTISTDNKASGLYKATIKKYKIECGTQQETVDESTTNITKTINNCKSSSLKITAIDSRGQERTVTKTVSNFKQYYNPSFGPIESERKNGVDTESYLEAQINFWNGNFGNGNNSIVALEYRTKQKTSNSYGSWNPISVSNLIYDGNKVNLKNFLIHANGKSGGFTIGVAYDIQLKVTDGLSSYSFVSIESDAVTLTDGKVGFSLLKDNDGNYHMGIDCMPNLNSPLTISQKSLADLIYPVGSIYMSVNSTSPQTLFGGTWEQLKDRFLVGAGNSYSGGGTGGATSVTSGKYSGTSGSTSGTSGAYSGTSGAYSGTSGSTTLKIEHMPSHTHVQNAHSHSQHPETWMNRSPKDGLVPTSGSFYAQANVSTYYTGSTTATNQNTGGDKGHTHSIPSHTHSIPSHTHSMPSHTHSIPEHTHSVSTMPPYLAVYIWKRTA